jgi:6-phosphogluconolactonase
MAEFLEFSSREAAGQALAEQVATLLCEGIAARGHGSLVVCGGTSQNHFFEALSHKDLPWEKVSIILGDERWVTADDDDSSEKLVRGALLKNKATAARIISQAKPDDAPNMTLEEGAARATALLKAIPQPFDANIVGMGEDGHTASLFPNHPALDGAMDENGEIKVVPVAHSPKPPAERLTFSLAAHINARHVMMNINGNEKREVYRKAEKNESSALDFPASALINNKKTPATIYWFLS